jgi:peptide chain release factor 2
MSILAISGGGFDVSAKEEELGTLERRASAPDFWTSTAEPQSVMRRLASLRGEVDLWRALERRRNDLAELAALEDDGLVSELLDETQGLEAQVGRLEFHLWLSGPYDEGDAIIAIHAGAGGTDAQDWAEMLARMYLRWAESRGYKTDVVDRLHGDEAGIKRIMISVAGRYAYGFARTERGVHRLVRLSPFDAAHRRHTSFSLVEAWPDIADDISISIDPNDLQIDTFRASSAGGQHMQKNETAVRVTHVPTGISVSCQNERSQSQNRETALRVLRARLRQREEEKLREQIADLKGDHIDAGWGNQIRSYVLHPYQMVKDHRTNAETGNIQSVLDGGLDDFMEAYLRFSLGTGEDGS